MTPHPPHLQVSETIVLRTPRRTPFPGSSAAPSPGRPPRRSPAARPSCRPEEHETPAACRSPTFAEGGSRGLAGRLSPGSAWTPPYRPAIGSRGWGRRPSPRCINIHEPAARRERGWSREVGLRALLPPRRRRRLGAGRATQVSAPPSGLDLLLGVQQEGDCVHLARLRPERGADFSRRRGSVCPGGGRTKDGRRRKRAAAWAEAGPQLRRRRRRLGLGGGHEPPGAEWWPPGLTRRGKRPGPAILTAHRGPRGNLRRLRPLCPAESPPPGAAGRSGRARGEEASERGTMSRGPAALRREG
ncbi:zinc finger protein 469-like [Homo sapiens]|uniref:zinc finger protein 469-like n=1 Tax=Homo sapiens TaxID=9606 RepID=UPI001FB143CF|nr:zinc finger protein 469-like [Homo sapiens]